MFVVHMYLLNLITHSSLSCIHLFQPIRPYKGRSQLESYDGKIWRIALPYRSFSC